MPGRVILAGFAEATRTAQTQNHRYIATSIRAVYRQIFERAELEPVHYEVRNGSYL